MLRFVLRYHAGVVAWSAVVTTSFILPDGLLTVKFLQCNENAQAVSFEAMNHRLFIIMFALLAAQETIPIVAAGADLDQVTVFLQQHCVGCHGADSQAAELRFDQLRPDQLRSDESFETHELWARILGVVESREMPPPDEPRPTDAEVKSMVGLIVERLDRPAVNSTQALRRLNRREYEHTVHNLLGIDVPLADLLPEDGRVQGFDNVADGLSISSVLMEQYLEAANVAFDAVIRRIDPLPKTTRRVQMMQVDENVDSVKKKKGGTIAVEDSFVKFTPGWPPARLDDVHPIEDGIYRCRVAVWPHDPGDRTLAVAVYVGALFGPETRKFMGIYDVTGTPAHPRIIEFTTHMQEGHSIHLEPRIWPEHVTWRDKHEARPGIGIKWAETHGPLDQSFPSIAQQKLFGALEHLTLVPGESIYMRHRKGVKLHFVESSQPREDVERIIREFVRRAFRRPVDESEIQPFVQLALGRLDAGRTFEQAVRAGVTGVLCSPQFLLLNRQAVADDYDIAARLSYFLSSSMPDQELLQLAAAGRMNNSAVRHAQVERMIHDARIHIFVNDFTDQWLDLKDIEFTTPADKLYPEFDPLLQEAMLGETRHFFDHLLQQDLSVINFVKSDFTFLNERLARHYGIEDVDGQETFRKISLPEGSLRGGVLTQASVLKVTANGTTTSPVIRGAWVMDRILGRPLPPPPSGVPAVEPDIRGATTIRQQLQQHSSDASCARCHKRIDPPGFALERFDAIGGERTWYRSIGDGEKIPGQKSYRKGPDVELAERLPDGRAFQDFRQFRDCLVNDPDTFVRALTTKLLVYATGRPIDVTDRSRVDQIVKSAGPNVGLKSIIHAIVDSDLFLGRRQ